MHIVSIDLENIKSYVREEITLTEGINAVCGPNGSGKTTLLEAIGFALFGFLPYSHQSFVREGARSGAVRVRLMDRRGEEYEVVRRVGTSATHSVVSVRSGTKLADRSENVLEWIREHALGLEPGGDLQALFENAVGVPQGKMTADFLNTARVRKSVFDPLLRVEEYRGAVDELLKTVNFLRDRMAYLTGEISELSRHVDTIPMVEGKVEGAQRALLELRAILARTLGHQKEVEAGKDRLDGVASLLEAARQDLNGAAYDVSRYQDQVVMHQRDLNLALEARRIVEKSAPGAELYREADSKLQMLESVRAERDSLKNEMTAATTAMSAIESQIQQVDADLQEAESNAREAEELLPEVARQEELESAIRELQALLRETTGAQSRLTDVQRQLAGLVQSEGVLEGRIAQAVSAQMQAERLPQIQEDRAMVQARLANLQLLEAKQSMVRDEGERLRQQHDILLADRARWLELQSRIATRQGAAVELDHCLGREREAREEQIRLEATINFQEVARADLKQHHCPLLDLQCPVVSADPTLLDRSDHQAAELRERLLRLKDALGPLEKAVGDALSAAEEVRALELQAAQILVSDDESRELSERLDACRQEYKELAEQVKDKRGLEEQEREFSAEEKRLQSAAQNAAQVGPLREQVESVRLQRESRIQEIAILELEVATRRDHEDTLRGLEDERLRLGDPRSRHAHLQAQASRRPELENRRADAQRSLQVRSDRARAIAGQLQRFAALDDEFEAMRLRKFENEEAFGLYLQHREGAAQVEDRTARVDEAEASLAVARERLHAAETRLEEASTSYDADQHVALQEEARNLAHQVGEETGRCEGLASDLDRQEQELARLRREEEKLRSRQREHGELEEAARAVTFIRDTIKGAGPVVTATLLSNISMVANDIFAEIMDDHAVELRWEGDYEVVTQKGSEERKFVQLSGGEQMSAALAIRLALLKEMSDIDVAFFDEPTQNMDGERRSNLAGQIRDVKGFDQLIVISHDDTFEHDTDNLIRLRKENDETHLEPV